MTLPTSGYTFDSVTYSFYAPFGAMSSGLSFGVTLNRDLGSDSDIEAIGVIVNTMLTNFGAAISGYVSGGSATIETTTSGHIDNVDVLDTP